MAMYLRQCFPSKWLTGDDLKELNPGVTTVTIQKVEVYQAKNDKGEPDVEFKMKFVEFSAPMRLKSMAAWDLGRLLQEEDMEKWPGQVVGIMPVQSLSFGKMKWFINISEVRPLSPPSIPPNTKIYDLIASQRMAPSLAAAPAKPVLDRTPIGDTNAALLKGGLQKHNKTYDEFMAFLKKLPGDEFKDAWGVELPQLPKYIGACFNQFIQQCKAAAGGTIVVGGDVVNPGTGEVLQPAAPAGPIPMNTAPAPAAAQPHPSTWGSTPGAKPVGTPPSDDIPF